MPFTFAHPLYSFPIKYLKPRYFSLAGLILGSMSPDFEYFIALEPHKTIGHTYKGLILQAIPLCIVFLFLFHMIKKQLILHLPSTFRTVAKAYGLTRPYDFRDVRQWAVFLISIVIGFYSHIFMDSFTHESGFFVNHYPVLQNVYFSVPLYKLLQYLFSSIGLCAEVLLAVFYIIKSPRPDIFLVRINSKIKNKYWLVVLITMISTTVIKLIFTSSTNTIGIIIVSPISGFVLGIIIASLKLSYKKG